MPRRVARALRGLLFAIGLLLTLAFVYSFFFGVLVRSAYPSASVAFWLAGGVVGVQAEYPGPDEDVGIRAWHSRATGEWQWADAAIPAFGHGPPIVSHPPASTTITEIQLPLWLLAFISLAWPVTSFILARRRRKRGFP